MLSNAPEKPDLNQELKKIFDEIIRLTGSLEGYSEQRIHDAANRGINSIVNQKWGGMPPEDFATAIANRIEVAKLETLMPLRDRINKLLEEQK